MTAPLFVAVFAAWLAFALFLLCAGWLSSRSSVASGAEPFVFREFEDVPPDMKARAWAREWMVRK